MPLPRPLQKNSPPGPLSAPAPGCRPDSRPKHRSSWLSHPVNMDFRAGTQNGGSGGNIKVQDGNGGCVHAGRALHAAVRYDAAIASVTVGAD